MLWFLFLCFHWVAGVASIEEVFPRSKRQMELYSPIKAKAELAYHHWQELQTATSPTRVKHLETDCSEADSRNLRSIEENKYPPLFPHSSKPVVAAA